MPRKKLTTSENKEFPSIEAWASSLNPAYLRCRTYGHDPEPSSVSVVTFKGSRTRYYEQTLHCTHGCGVRWTQLVNMRTGEQLERRVHYADAPGYLAKGFGVSGGERKNKVRLEEIGRRFSAQSEAETQERESA